MAPIDPTDCRPERTAHMSDGSGSGTISSTSSASSLRQIQGSSSLLHQVIAVSIWVWSIYASGALQLAAVVCLVLYGVKSLGAILLAVVVLLLAVVPLEWTSGIWSRAFIEWCCVGAADYFSVKVVVEDEESIKAGTSYVCAMEPHSAMPVALPFTFAPQSRLLPKALRGHVYGMASSVCFRAPVVRQLWWWLGVRPISRDTIHSLLQSGRCVVLVPGGVQECLHMHHGCEVAFLRQRTGFVRLAIQNGAPIIPVFAFGQSAAYRWYRPGPANLVAAISRTIGAVPLWIYGVCGTSIPHPSPITVVLGRPIPVPQMDDPPADVVHQLLDRYITDLVDLFERNKALCGAPGLELRVL